MSWFVKLPLKSGGDIHVRPDMVKAVYQKPNGDTNIVVDGHDFVVDPTVAEVMMAVEYNIEAEPKPL